MVFMVIGVVFRCFHGGVSKLMRESGGSDENDINEIIIVVD